MEEHQLPVGDKYSILFPISFCYQVKFEEAIASTLMLPSMRGAQIKLEKANSNLKNDDIKFLDWNNFGTNHNRASQGFFFFFICLSS